MQLPKRVSNGPAKMGSLTTHAFAALLLRLKQRCHEISIVVHLVRMHDYFLDGSRGTALPPEDGSAASK